MRLRFLLFFAFALAGCASRPVVLTPEQSRSAIVFVPGIYGTALVDSEGERVFLTLGQALWGSTPLALTDPDLGVQGARTLHVAGLLTGVPIIPWLYSIDGYGEAETYLMRQFGGRNAVMSMPYDWRRDCFKAVEDLDQLIQKLKARGVTRVGLVSHSMGGLITAYYLRYGTQPPEGAVENWEGARQVHAAVLVGVPFGGAIQSFHNLLNGTSLGTAETPLSAESLGTFPSMYELMPAEDMQSAINLSKQPLPDPFRDFALWKKRQWGLLQFPATPAVKTRREQVLGQYLRRSSAFSKKLRAPAGATPGPRLPGLVIQGIGRPTHAKGQWRAQSLNEEGGWNFGQDELSADGDGVVTLESSKLPSGFDRGLKYAVLLTDSSHTEQLHARAPQEAIAHFLHAHGF
jgi:pimeloyl-ACP methyl ester carboxylesterase